MSRPEPFHKTCDKLVKCSPVTVRMKAGPPATAVDGEREVRTGALACNESVLKTHASSATLMAECFKISPQDFWDKK